MTLEFAGLAGQVALITGGAGAIGRAISEGLIRAGAKVALVDIASERLQSYGEQLASQAGPGRVLAIVADVCDSQQVKRAFDLTLKEFGQLDILVNNAAATQIKAVDLLSDEDIDRIIDTNLKGYVKCAREAVKIMKGSGIKGTLLFISSKNGLEGASNKSLYCATKGGELALARALARELGQFGIRVNSICPDAVLEGSALWEDDSYRLGTARRYNISEEEIPDYYRERCALKTNIKPRDVANAALFLISDNAAKITGAILSVDGGVAFVR
ncbi:MAG: SDR family oxidoreductase [Anaerolineae bacterium]|jgi:NAD(P)-dependent dehydrogenase (short-subunit alcohol dehydrogenase family)